MDYTYPKEKTVKLDCNVEKTLFDIKDTLKQVVEKLEDLDKKIENSSKTSE